MANTIIDALLNAPEPAGRFKVLRNVLGERPESAEVKRVQDQVRSSSCVQRLLSQRTADGTIPTHPYAKWNGAHWVLATLADIGYASADNSLIPLREQIYGWLLSNGHRRNIPVTHGRARRCASQEGNAVYAQLKLGLAEARTKELARSLHKWQWPDGG